MIPSELKSCIYDGHKTEHAKTRHFFYDDKHTQIKLVSVIHNIALSELQNVSATRITHVLKKTLGQC